jgi:hypothetical protein
MCGVINYFREFSSEFPENFLQNFLRISEEEYLYRYVKV